MYRSCICTLLLAACLVTRSASAGKNDWAEGTRAQADGATRDYYNRAGLLAWKHGFGDWHDAAGREQGGRPYASAMLRDDDRPKAVAWDVTPLVREWVGGKHPNQGMLLRGLGGTGSFHFRSREYSDPEERPRLIVTVDAKEITLSPSADTYLERSTYRSLGHTEVLRVAKDANHALLRFDLGRFKKGGPITRAVLRLHTFAQYGGATLEVGVFRCSQGHDDPDAKVETGLASRYPGDKGMGADAAVIFFADFESDKWGDRWSHVDGRLEPLAEDALRKFAPLQGKALSVRIAKGSTGAMNVTWQFRKQTGKEPEEIYFRYYLRLADDWNQTLQGGKLPGISGTYGVAGWGGRKSNGRDGWSARGSFSQTIPAGNPLAGTTPIGTYCYHADMKGNYGDIWLWQKGYRGFLVNNRWYCVEQHLKLNTPGKNDGVLRAWIDGRLAFSKRDIRFRHVPELKIEQVWMNVYHGGTRPSPRDQHLYVDNVVIATRYIGPMR